MNPNIDPMLGVENGWPVGCLGLPSKIGKSEAFETIRQSLTMSILRQSIAIAQQFYSSSYRKPSEQTFRNDIDQTQPERSQCVELYSKPNLKRRKNTLFAVF